MHQSIVVMCGLTTAKTLPQPKVLINERFFVLARLNVKCHGLRYKFNTTQTNCTQSQEWGSRTSLSDVRGVVESAGANVHLDLHQIVEAANC